MKKILLAIIMVAVLFTGLGSIQRFDCAPIFPDVELAQVSGCGASCHSIDPIVRPGGPGSKLFADAIEEAIAYSAEGNIVTAINICQGYTHPADCQCGKVIDSNIFSSTVYTQVTDDDSLTNQTKPNSPIETACGIATIPDCLGVSVITILDQQLNRGVTTHS